MASGYDSPSRTGYLNSSTPSSNHKNASVAPPSHVDDIEIHESLEEAERVLDDLNTPVDRLPTEILSEIFLLVVEPRATFDTKSELWKLGRVCGRWRSVSSSMKQIWATIHIELYSMSPMSSGAALEILCEIMDRSDPALLSITYGNIPPHLFKSDKLLLLRPLVSACQRWRSINFPEQLLDLDYFGRVRGNVPHLEALEIGGRIFGSVDRRDLDIFEVAPKLRSVTYGVRDVDVRLPWSQLTRFEYQGPRDPTHLLGAMPNLTELTLWGPVTTPIPAGAPLLLNQLGQINLVWLGGEIWNHFTLPALEGISIVGYNEFSITPLEALLHRSSCRITRFNLVLSSIKLDDPCTLSLFELLHTLVELNLKPMSAFDDAPDGVQFMDRMTYRLTHPDHPILPLNHYLFPHLEILKVDIASSNSISFDPHSFVQVVSSRQELSSSEATALRSLEVRYSEEACPLTMDTIADLPRLWV